jgi:A/G-specific adenine glycosylase
MTLPQRDGDASARLLAWYDVHRRNLPWRAPPGQRADPYRVWLSEIMLQQTTVATVGPYFRHFLTRWPTVSDLAAAELDEVLHAWQGLGYYARARNLHACARKVAADLGGHFPDTETDLLKLPGIGPYTAAAVAAIAFDQPATPVDGNFERVMARRYAVETPLPDAKPELRRLAAELTPSERPGDHAQAVMDLGATICVPRNPDCGRCPWADDCRGLSLGIAGELPRRRPKKARPTRVGDAFWAVSLQGRVLLRRRPERGLLGGMMEVPGSEWTEVSEACSAGVDAAPFAARWRALPGAVEHTFTHFHLRLTVQVADGVDEASAPEGTVWCALEDLGDHALPTVMKKVVRHALAAGVPVSAVRT